MRLDKHSPNKSDHWPVEIAPLTEGEEDDEGRFMAAYQSHLRTIISRAITVYVVLFCGLGVIMSLAGVNPLTKQGLMPKGLFVFVLFALLIALVNTLTHFSQEPGYHWTQLMRGLVRSRERRCTRQNK